MLLGVVLVGAGEGLYDPADRTLVSDLSRRRRGRAFGFHSVANDVSGMLGAGLAAAALAAAVWRTAFLPSIVVLGATMAAVHVWGREPIVVGRVALGIRETVGRLFGTARFRRPVVAYALFVFTVTGVVGFLPTFLQAVYGFAPAAAGGVFALFFAVVVVVKPLAGRLSGLIARPYVAVGGLGLGALGIGLLVTATSTVVVVAGVVVFAAGQKAFPPAVNAHLMDVFPDGSMGGDLGATRTVYIGLGSLGPTYVGFVAGRADYVVAYAGFIGVFLAAGVVMLWLSLTVRSGA